MKQGQKRLNTIQLKAISGYLIEVSKSITLAIILGILFPQVSSNTNIVRVIVGLFFCIICLSVSIILLKEVKTYDT